MVTARWPWSNPELHLREEVKEASVVIEERHLEIQRSTPCRDFSVRKRPHLNAVAMRKACGAEVTRRSNYCGLLSDIDDADVEPG